MPEQMAGLPYWELTFDAQGDPDSDRRAAFLAEVPAAGLTDLFVFSHGWNNDRAVAARLFKAFYGLLAGQLAQVPAERGVKAGLAGVVWPSQRWSDEPIPDFEAVAPSGPDDGGGAARLVATTSGRPASADPRVDPDTLAGLREVFPTATGPLDRMAELLAAPPSEAALTELHQCMKEFANQAGARGTDGEDDRPGREDGPPEPGMLQDEPDELFERYRERLAASGVPLSEDGGGEAGIGDRLRGLWQGAKEALRQLTYWQMKNRAGDVGRKGLGPLLGDLHAAAPNVRIHLLGHSFGGRLVSYALAGLPDGLSPSPVKAVTLLQGAFSHFAFAKPLPFNANRTGALAGMLDRIDGPLAVCFSEHDKAVGIFYPLASMAARDDSAAAQGAFFRWGAMGADGAQGVNAKLDTLDAPGTSYRFAPHEALNIDAAPFVRRGGPPSGAHSDIVHPELTWVVLAAGGLVP
jgi:hypothetical protein